MKKRTTRTRQASRQQPRTQGREVRGHHTDDQPFREANLLAALVLSREALERFVGLGIGLQIFTDPDIRAIARWAISGVATLTPEIRSILLRREDLASTIQRYFAQIRWAVRDVDRFVAAYAHRWMPMYFRHWADQCDRGDFTTTAQEVRACFNWLDELLEAHA